MEFVTCKATCVIPLGDGETIGQVPTFTQTRARWETARQVGLGYPDLRIYFHKDDLVFKKPGLSSSPRRCRRTEEELLSPYLHRRLWCHQG